MSNVPETQSNSFADKIRQLRYDDYVGGVEMYDFIGLDEAGLFLQNTFPDIDSTKARFIRDCQQADSIAKRFAPNAIYTDPTSNRYLYEMSLTGDSMPHALGVAIDGSTMAVTNEFISQFAGGSDTDEKHSTSTLVDQYTYAFSHTANLGVRIAHERIHQITFANDRLISIEEDKSTVDKINQQILATQPIDIEPRLMGTAKPLGIHYQSGVLLLSYFDTEEGIKGITVGNAMNELFTNHLAQYIEQEKVSVHPLLQVVINTVGDYDQAMGMFLASDFVAIQALFDGKNGEGSYVRFLKDVDDLNTISENIDIAQRVAAGQEAMDRLTGRFESKYGEIMSEFGS